jgi:hypothetical protein
LIYLNRSRRDHHYSCIDKGSEDDMFRTRILIVSVLVGGLVFGSQAAYSHCDSVDGPVAKAVEKALESGNVFPVLAYAPASAEAEIRASFEKSRKVRTLGADARALADRAFLETAIRLHRQGEGAPYTGIKPAGLDYGPAIPAAEHAVETGDLSKLRVLLVEAMDHALEERFAHVRRTHANTHEPENANEVAAARERISTELEFITFAETLRQAALGKFAEHEAD